MNQDARLFYSLPPEQQAHSLIELAREAVLNWPGQYDQLTLVKHRENAVFSAFRSDGLRVAIRVHRHAYHSDNALLSELAWMQALASDGIPVPAVVPTRAGELFGKVNCRLVPEERQVDMLTWLSGTPIGSSDQPLNLDLASSSKLFEECGALAARIHRHSSGWKKPGHFVRHAWDEAGLVGENPFWGRFWELSLLTPAQRILLGEARARASRDLALFGKGPDRYGLIHADFAAENLLHNGRNLILIDFDDCGYGWYMFELATALLFRRNEPHFDALTAAAFAGYERTNLLHRQTFPLFLFLRASTYLGWVQTRRETECAIDMAPMLIDLACSTATAYLESPSGVGEC